MLSDYVSFIYNDLATVLCPFPVGGIYMSTSSTNPSDIFPNTTWEAWGTGKVPVGVDSSDTDFNTSEKTGGAKSHSYTPAGTNSKPTFTGTKATLSHSGGAVGSHTLKESEIPAHNHSIVTITGNFGALNVNGGSTLAGYVYTGGTAKSNTTNKGGGSGHSHGFTQPTAHTYTPAGTNSAPTFTGTASTQSHLQPYITCYMWKRTA